MEIGCPGRIDFESGGTVWLRSKLEFLDGISQTVRLGNRLGYRVVRDNRETHVP